MDIFLDQKMKVRELSRSFSFSLWHDMYFVSQSILHPNFLPSLSIHRLISSLGSPIYEALKEKNTGYYLSRIQKYLPSDQASMMNPSITGSFPKYQSVYTGIHQIPPQPYFEYLVDSYPTVSELSLLDGSIKMLIICWLTCWYSKSSFKNEFSDISSNRNETAPSTKQLEFQLISVAFMILVSLRMYTSCSSRMQKPSIRISINLFSLEVSLMMKLKLSICSWRPLTSSEEPSIIAYFYFSSSSFDVFFRL